MTLHWPASENEVHCRGDAIRGSNSALSTKVADREAASYNNHAGAGILRQRRAMGQQPGCGAGDRRLEDITPVDGSGHGCSITLFAPVPNPLWPYLVVGEALGRRDSMMVPDRWPVRNACMAVPRSRPARARQTAPPAYRRSADAGWQPEHEDAPGARRAPSLPRAGARLPRAGAKARRAKRRCASRPCGRLANI